MDQPGLLALPYFILKCVQRGLSSPNGRRLVLIPLLLVGLLIIEPAKAADAPVPQRQALLEIANKSMALVITKAMSDQSFTATLSPAEIQMIETIEQIVMRATSLRWLKSAKIPYGLNENGPAGFNFVYVDLAHDPMVFVTDTLDAPELVFSNDRERFKNLEPDQPERDARTSEKFSAPFEINLHRLNSPEVHFDFGQAYSLLFHEYWRKTGSKGLQATADSISNKFREYVQNQVNTIQLKNGTKLHSFSFNTFDPFAWYNYGLFRGLYDFFKKRRIPGAKPSAFAHWLPVLHQQGLWLWTEANQQITDQTENLLSTIKRRGTIRRDFPEEKLYHFAEQNIYLLNSLNVREEGLPPGQLKIEVDFAQLSAEQMFRIPGVSPNPRTLGAMDRYYRTQVPASNEGQRVEISASYNGPLLQLQKPKRVERSRIYLPGISAKLIESTATQEQLQFKLQLNAGLDESVPHLVGDLRIDRADIWLKAGDRRISLSSVTYDAAERIYSFELNGIDKLQVADLEIDQIEFYTDTRTLVDEQFGVAMVLRNFEKLKLPKILTPQAKAESPDWKPQLISTTVPSDGKLRFVLTGTTPLESIELKVNMSDNVFFFDKVFVAGKPKPEVLYVKAGRTSELPSDTLTLKWAEPYFKQQVVGERTVVEVDPAAFYEFHKQELFNHRVAPNGLAVQRFLVHLKDPEKMQIEEITVTNQNHQRQSFEGPAGLRVQMRTPSPDPIHRLARFEDQQRLNGRLCRRLFR